MIILGIDPGYDRLGWAILESSGKRSECLAVGLLQTEKKNLLSQRLLQIHREIDTVITQYSPTIAIVEELFFSTNQKTAIAVAQSRGVIIAALALHQIEIKEYTPMQIKSIVAGTGRADKKAIEKMVRLQLPGLPAHLVDDTLDAIAAAYAYICDNSYG